MPRPDYDESVFLNCPLDNEYAPLFRALVFAVQDCGFAARSALESGDCGEVRIVKIARIIGGCRLGIHDLSRTEPDRALGLPRFNMPLELGLFLGARAFGGARHREKQCLVLDREPYRYRGFCSDIAGQDVRAHDDHPEALIRAVRSLLVTAREGPGLLPGPQAMFDRFCSFLRDLPTVCARCRLDPWDLQFVELRTLVEEWVEENQPVCA